MTNSSTFSAFTNPLYVMLKPIGAVCNLACDYCYYLEKSNLYKDNPKHVMSEALLEKFVEDYINSQTTQHVLFMWHGGETLMQPLSFYEKATKLQQKYRGRIIDNCIQTNGTLLTDEWCHFLKSNNWLVGISIDGPQEFHDKYRRNKQGLPSFRNVMKGVNLLNKYGVEWNAMAVVNNYNADYPLEFYNFFKSIGCHYIQFAPIVERLIPHTDGRHLASAEDATSDQIAPFSVTPTQWGNFICSIFDEWIRNDVGEYFIQLFDSTLANWVGEAPSLCTLAKTCGHASVMEFNGDVYSCDHFVFPPYKLGNVNNKTLLEMMYGNQQIKFGLDKYNLLPSQCKNCKYLFACNGECPKNRFLNTQSGESGLNYLCEGYYRFFKHTAPYMNFMKQQLENQSSPANVMYAIRNGSFNV